jgi:hypothetical protein
MKQFLFFSILILLISCKTTSIGNNADIENKKEIRLVMQMQENAWNQGDIEKFMTGYWKNEKLKFVGSRGISYGWETTLSNYKKSYPNVEIMGKLHFEIDLIERLSDDTYYLIGRYSLQRKNDEPSGYFNLIWRKINGKWKIITDMTCG